MQRFGIDITTSNRGDLDFAGSVVVMPPGTSTDDALGRTTDSAGTVTQLTTLQELEADVGCLGCLATTTSAGFADSDAGNFQLTPQSTCCVGSGRDLGDDAPHDDILKAPRPSQGPSVGPYQFNP